jgi:hypothetical protein
MISALLYYFRQKTILLITLLANICEVIYIFKDNNKKASQFVEKNKYKALF